MADKNSAPKPDAGANNKTLTTVALSIAAIIGVVALIFFSSKMQKSPSAVESKASEVAQSQPNQAQDDLEEVAADEIVPEIIPGDPVVAKIGDKEIKRSDVMEYIRTFPPQIQQVPVQQLFPMALDQLVNERLVRVYAAKANLDNDPDVKKRLKEAKDEIVATAFLKKEIESNITDEQLQAAYDEHIAGLEEVEEAKALHILVEDKSKAHDLIQKLEKGEDFAELAAEHSIDKGSAANGGDIGYFTREEVVPEFAEVAFTLEEGKHSFEPVKTQFGYHVVKLLEKRTRPVPTLEDLKPQLDGQLRQKSMAGLFKNWREKSSVAIFDINGEAIEKPDDIKPAAGEAPVTDAEHKTDKPAE